MLKGRGWFSSGLLKPKNPHSLEQLKYLYNFLSKNQQVSDSNRGLLVETLRSIAEILIWGDQNDSSVFDFFLEKNMLSFFLKIMRQKCGRYVCIQLLQTLNILFENIRNETSLYYLLSNNHVNSIIVHKFDFSDEEVMAYYISFLKTLSLKLNSHTVHFFYNEHTHDFPLYTEAIKFFNHSESMVRIAVRTLTLNVYKVDDKSMLKFIRDKTAAPYFSNLVWFIANHIIELDQCATSEADHVERNRLSDLVAEHLDHLHYLNDMLLLDVESINEVLTDHLLHRLFIPLYVYSLTKGQRMKCKEDGKPNVCSVVSLFLLSQVFLIISHWPLVRHLAQIIIINQNSTSSKQSSRCSSCELQNDQGHTECFMAPPEPLEKCLESTCSNDEVDANDLPISSANGATESPVNVTDEEKAEVARHSFDGSNDQQQFNLSDRPYLEAVFNTLNCSDNDHEALFALCLLYALGHNAGINQQLLDSVFIPTDRSETKHWYNVTLVEKLIDIIHLSCQHNSKVRLATLELSILIFKQLVYKNGKSFLQDSHLASVEQAREESTLLLRNFYKSEEVFLDMFEDEYREMKRKPLNVEYLTMDSSILLEPTGTPLSGVEFHKRLPCGEVERAKQAIRVFFFLRDLSMTLRMEPETQLPLTNPQSCIRVGDVLDLNNSDLIACTVVSKDGSKIRRFLVIDVIQLILVEPDFKKLGWGVAKFVGFLQDIEVSGDKDDSRCLHITVHKPCGSVSSSSSSSSVSSSRSVPLLVARFVFDDHIRCMAAKQRLTKGRLKARQRKMHQIARLLELPGNIQPCPSPPAHSIQPFRQSETHIKLQRASGHVDHGPTRSRSSSNVSGSHRPLFNTGAMAKVPGVATMLKKEGQACSNSRSPSSERQQKSTSHSPRNSTKTSVGDSGSRISSHISEEIPLEVINSPKKSEKTKSSKVVSEPESIKENGNGIDPEPKKQTEQLQPKTLRKADAPAVSLLLTSALVPEREVTVTAPKLVPPTESPPSPSSLQAIPNEFIETSFTENRISSPAIKSCGGGAAHVSPVCSPNDVTMMSVSVDSQSFDPSSDAAMATASITSSTVSSEILDETLDESIMSDSIERFKSFNSNIKTL